MSSAKPSQGGGVVSELPRLLLVVPASACAVSNLQLVVLKSKETVSPREGGLVGLSALVGAGESGEEGIMGLSYPRLSKN